MTVLSRPSFAEAFVNNICLFPSSLLFRPGSVTLSSARGRIDDQLAERRVEDPSTLAYRRGFDTRRNKFFFFLILPESDLAFSAHPLMVFAQLPCAVTGINICEHVS